MVRFSLPREISRKRRFQIHLEFSDAKRLKNRRCIFSNKRQTIFTRGGNACLVRPDAIFVNRSKMSQTLLADHRGQRVESDRPTSEFAVEQKACLAMFQQRKTTVPTRCPRTPMTRSSNIGFKLKTKGTSDLSLTDFARIDVNFLDGRRSTEEQTFFEARNTLRGPEKWSPEGRTPKNGARKVGIWKAGKDRKRNNSQSLWHMICRHHGDGKKTF